MLYYFFEFLEKNYQIPGASLFTYISFRTAAATILSLLISTIFGKKIIKFLKQPATRTINILAVIYLLRF